MFQLQNKQTDIFKTVALKKFEDEMVDHIKQFFPNHYISMQEEAVRKTIMYGYFRAEIYGFTTKRNVCLYINTMMVLGSNFDYDPLYPWTQSMLRDNKEDPKVRIDKIADKTMEVFGQILGPLYLHINRALMNINSNADEIFARLTNNNLSGALQQLELLYPRKFQVLGEPSINHMVKFGVDNANNYGITYQSNTLVYIACMFMMGSGFDKDPQFYWAGEILNDPAITDQDKKIKLLYDQAVSNLRKFLLQYYHS